LGDGGDGKAQPNIRTEGEWKGETLGGRGKRSDGLSGHGRGGRAFGSCKEGVLEAKILLKREKHTIGGAATGGSGVGGQCL